MEMIEAQRQYQMVLEVHRVDPDDEEARDELQRAQAALEVAWIETQMK